MYAAILFIVFLIHINLPPSVSIWLATNPLCQHFSQPHPPMTTDKMCEQSKMINSICRALPPKPLKHKKNTYHSLHIIQPNYKIILKKKRLVQK